MKFGSLFAGIGGLDLGLEASGMECAWQVERDDYCRQVLEKHWPRVRRFGDIEECGAHNLDPVELICGGFPCQPVSSAGARAGTDDERWLWPQFHRIICELRPRWVVAENVTGLLSANSGRAMGEVLGNLAASGYDAVWDIFPAGGPGGVGAPHRRERVFIMAHANGTGTGEQDRNIQYGQIAKAERSERFRNVFEPSGSDVPNPDSAQFKGGGVSDGIHQKHPDISDSRGWAVEPNVGRVAYGVPSRVDRLKCLGNAVVPQVARQIGELIINVQDIQGRIADN